MLFYAGTRAGRGRKHSLFHPSFGCHFHGGRLKPPTPRWISQPNRKLNFIFYLPEKNNSIQKVIAF